MIRVNLEPCFILHSRPYRNTSLIVELLSQHHGRVVAVARSARGLKSRYKGNLQVFVPLLASWSGRGELMQLGGVELRSMPYELNGNHLLSGFYLNELLMRFLPHHDGCPQVFEHYQDALQSLANGGELEQNLRRFEKQLLARLGYGLTLNHDHYGDPIDEQTWYQFIPQQGLQPSRTIAPAAHLFCGSSLLALHHEQWSNPRALQDAKRLMRLVIAHHLGHRPLKSRELMS